MKRFYLSVLFLTLCTGIASAQNQTAANREALRIEARSETARLSAAQLPTADLGDWKQVIDASLFMLLRKTEITRGQVNVIVVSADQVFVKFLPDGSFVISSALLDFIDLALFSEIADSTRRIRNFDAERENRLAPFLAYEIAVFALDQNWRKITTAAASPLSSTALIREADGFAKVLLEICGYPADTQDNWFSTLEQASREGESPLADYLKATPRPSARKTAMQEDTDRNEALAVELKTALFALREGLALENSLKAILNLQEVFPDSPYLQKLTAFFHHRLFLSVLSSEQLYLVPLLPFDTGRGIDRSRFAALLEKTFSPPVGLQTGTDQHYQLALSGYTAALDHFEDNMLLSARATLLALSPRAEDQNEALRIAELAALRENQETGYLSNANWAWVLFYTGRDRERARQITANSLFLQTKTLETAPQADRKTALLSPGYPANSLDLLLNLALLSHAEKNNELAITTMQDWRAATQPAQTDSLTIIALRGVSAGNTAAQLESAWGRPAEIINDYQTEYWYYASLRARVILNTGSSGMPHEVIRAIYLENLSPISLPGDIRCGDTREDFETVYGKPVYRSGDSEVYVRGSNRIAVFYLSGRIRFLSVGL